MAKIRPCPGMSRGADDVVPTVPGFVSETVVPMKSSGEIVPLRERVTRSSNALRKPGEVELVRVLDVRDEQGAASVLALHVDGDAEADGVALDPVGLALELAIRVVQARERVERPEDRPRHEVGEATFLAHGSRCLLRIRRFSSRARTGTVRTDVAVGTWRLASMFSTMRNAPPRIGWAMSPGKIVGMAMARETGRLTIGAGAEGATAAPGLGDAGATSSPSTAAVGGGDAAGSAVTASAVAALPPFGPTVRPVALSKYSRQVAST